MDTKRFRVGSIAILFAVVMLCVSVLAALTVSTAVSDRRTAQRYGEYVRRLNQCQNAGQQWLADADAYLRGQAPLPDGASAGEGSLAAQLTRDNMVLDIRLTVSDAPGVPYQISEWRCRALWQPEDEVWHLWRQ